jgi:hypothetical protein
MHCISILLQGMRDGWFTEDEMPKYQDVLRRLFFFFFATYLDQEQGFLVIRDAERSTLDRHTTRMANFDAARYLCQWSRLARSIGGTFQNSPAPTKRTGRWINFDKSHKKEQGLFLYHDPESGLAIQLPLVSGANESHSASLAFPHSPGIFDFPVNKYVPVMVPELTFGNKVVVPCFYGKRCTTSLGLRNSLVFKFEQPELITVDETFVNGLGSAKVAWSFSGKKITADFTFTVKAQVQLDRMRLIVPIGAPHSTFRIPTTFALGDEFLRVQVLKDDFQAAWTDTESVVDDPDYRTYHGRINYLQVLERDHPLIMRPGQSYRLLMEYDPDIVFADE